MDTSRSVLSLRGVVIVLSAAILVVSVLVSSALATPPQQNIPTRWWVNCNGYIGWLVYTVDPASDRVTGTLLGTPVEGYLVGRHLVLHRFPTGRTQIWDAWILDPGLGAAGQPYYSTDYVLAGTCSESKTPADGVYPFFGIEEGKTAGLPGVTGPTAGGTGGPGGTMPGGGPGGTGGSGGAGALPGGGPTGTVGSPGNWDLTPGVWTPHHTAQGRPIASANQLCIDSMAPGGAWFTRPRPYGFDRDYRVEFDFRLGTADNHYILLYSDGFISVDIDWGTDIGHAQPGAAYGVRNRLMDLTPDRWHAIRIDARPSAGEFDLFVDGRKLSTATGIRPILGHHTASPQQTDPDVIYFGDPDDVSHRGGAYNRGAACWRNVRVQGASTAGSGAPGGTPGIGGAGAAGPAILGNWELPPGVWIQRRTGQGRTEVNGDELCIDSMVSGGGWFARPRPYGFESNYRVEFEFQLRETNNHYILLYSDGFIGVDIDWGTDLGHVQPGAAYGLRNRLMSLQPGRWYAIRVDARPTTGEFDLYVDGSRVSTATGVRPIHPYHVLSASQSDAMEIFFGDADDLANQGGAYNRGSACWRNLRVRGASTDPAGGIVTPAPSR